MPNYCNTNITFAANNKQQITSFYERCLAIYNGKATAENGFGKGWLGDFVNSFLAPETTSESTLIRHRGYVYHIGELEEDDDSINFEIQTETAWIAMIKMWRTILEQLYPDIEIYYVAEECGMDYYVNSDKENRFYLDKYKLDYQLYVNGSLEEMTDYYFDEQTIREEIERLFQICSKEIEIENLNECLNKIIEERGHEDEEYISIGIFVEELEEV